MNARQLKVALNVNAHGIPVTQACNVAAFQALFDAYAVHYILGAHVRGSTDKAVQKSILRHEKLNRRSLRDIA